MSDQELYARVRDGEVIEFPVLKQHIENRAHPMEWYVLCKQDKVPDISKYEYLVQKPEVVGRDVVVRYTVHELDLFGLYNFVYPERRLLTDEVELKDISEVEPALVRKISEKIDQHIQKRLEEFAAERGYGSLVSACSYANSTIEKFANEGRRCVELRDQCWAALYQKLDDITSGREKVPATPQEIMAVIPALTWEEESEAAE